MLYIVRKTRNEELTWHVGNPKPMNVIRKPEYEPGQRSYHQEATESFTDIVEVQADGDELVFIRTYGVNLPDCRAQRVMRWKGEMAQFIYDNIIGVKP